MNKQEWKNLLFVLRDFAKRDRNVLICMVILSVIQGARPYVAVVLTGFLLDAVYAGSEAAILLKYALLGVGFSCMAALIQSAMLKFLNQKIEYMLEIQNRTLNEKGMRMDYEYLEDIHVHDIRQRVEKCFGSFGLWAGIISDLNDWLVAAVSMIAAVFIVLPMFVHSNMASGSVIGSWYMSLLFFFILGILTWINFKGGVFFNKKIRKCYDNISPFENRKKFYMNILAGYEEQKDLRIYQEQPIYEKEADMIAAGEQKVRDEIARYTFGSSTLGQTLSAIIGLIVYVFAGLQAYAGIISIGSVVTYAASILKFTISVSQFTSSTSDLKMDAGYAGDYVKYMQLEKRKYDGAIPVEKRRDERFSVEFEHVSFRYPGSEKYVIKDLSLKFDIGEKMAIVGKKRFRKDNFYQIAVPSV